MLIRLPRLRSLKSLAASRDMSMTPVTLVAKTAAKLARSMSISSLNTPTPALLIRMSRSPSFSLTSRKVRRTSASFATSACMPTTPSERAASASRSGSRPVMATRAPACFNTSAAARPIPLDPPVIRTTAFLRSISYLDNMSVEKFLGGVSRFKKDVYPQNQDLFEKLALRQRPEALFITCADSRIDPCLLTQTQPGELFICRVIGNIVPLDPDSLGGVSATIEYAVGVLRVAEVIVCGHTDCGVIRGALHPDALVSFGAVWNWLRYANVPTREAHPTEECLLARTEENVVTQLKNLRSHPSVANRLRDGDLTLNGWVYDIGKGMVTVYNEESGKFEAPEIATGGVANPDGLSKNMAALDWSQCPAVESIPGKGSGAWVLRGTRTPVKVLFENLEAGMSIEEVIEQFAVLPQAKSVGERLSLRKRSSETRMMQGGARFGQQCN